MTTVVDRVDVQARRIQRAQRRGSVVVNWLTTTDHKLIGQLYLITSFGFFIIAGIMALLMRAELARPGLQFLTPEEYN
ncbi:MAG: cytochrome ubiquinol oxidase subunit I, partial [Acidothermus cellulolyticus]|nr:cytochrome ubiquinol oxidase subunit I [Acidothermus cellulolyticus]